MTTSLLAYLLIPLFTAVIIPFVARTRHKLADVLASVTLLAGLINIGAILFNPANIANSFSNINTYSNSYISFPCYSCPISKSSHNCSCSGSANLYYFRRTSFS